MNDEHKGISIDIYNDGIGKVQLIQHWGTDATIVRSARVSFGADSDKEELSDRDVKLINYLIKHRHTSTFEHCGVTLKFIVPLFVRSQHHRHRTWSYNEISRRYTDVNIQFYEPTAFRTQHKSNRQASNSDDLINPMLEGKTNCSELIAEHHRKCLYLYNNLIEGGVCREQARGVLPQNMYTEYYGTVNLNNLIKFIDLRTHAGAQWEIQRAAEACLSIATELWPTAIKAYVDLKNSL
jgi:thymidylate synthase (FAD)